MLVKVEVIMPFTSTTEECRAIGQFMLERQLAQNYDVNWLDPFERGEARVVGDNILLRADGLDKEVQMLIDKFKIIDHVLVVCRP